MAMLGNLAIQTVDPFIITHSIILSIPFDTIHFVRMGHLAVLSYVMSMNYDVG